MGEQANPIVDPARPAVALDATATPPEGLEGDFPIVGIGASAGGLEALKEFFEAMPPESGMAFVIVQHLDPKAESRMAEILTKSTTMKVTQAEDGMPVQPNTVLTNPPGRPLTIHDGRLILAQPTERRHVEAAIDHFLTSLAEDRGSKAFGIILSGSSGSDGPGGIRAIRDAGGMCMAQEPGTAQYAAMPQATIDTGLVDYVLPPARMPEALMGFAQHSHVQSADREEPSAATPAQDVEAVLQLLRSHANSDYRHYKRSTVLRRIQRRMGLRQIETMGDYLKLLERDADELKQLAKDMLIGVSAFFRDPEVFEDLQAQVILPLAQAKDEDQPLRAWVAGCATGQEAYSIAMLLMEARSAAGKPGRVQVFATDIDERALETARAGTYPQSIAEEITPARLEAFFTKHGPTYRVSKPLRDAVIFSRHNVLSDPPFSKLDLVSCRNVLIYLDPAAQKRVLTVFSFSLNVGGGLLLGNSENAAGMEHLFEPLSPKNRLYRLLRANRPPTGFPTYASRPSPSQIEPERAPSEASLLAHANLESILAHFQASAVLIDPRGKVLYFHGPMEKYLGHPRGIASLNILDMIGGTVSAKLRRAIDQALHKGEPVSLPAMHLPLPGNPVADLTVLCVPNRAGAGTLLAVIFEDSTRPPQPTGSVSAEDEPLVAQLESEVKALHSELRANAEGYDSASEELKAANEEVMSMNEELQSANEELEASREEMQSLNEELTTVNSQLNDKVSELTLSNNDLANLLQATDIATIFLDMQLCIRRFTPRATELLNLIDSDLGRPIHHITQNVTGVDLTAEAGKVLKSLAPLEKEVQGRDGRWFLLRILAYRTLDHRIDGVAITFSDVDHLKQSERRLGYEKAYAESIVAMVRHPLLVLDQQLRVLSANAAFHETFQVQPDQTVGQLVYDLGNRQWDIPLLRKLLEEVMPQDSAFQDFRVEHEFLQIGRKVMLLSGRRIDAIDDVPQRILLTIEDITQRERDRAELQSLNAGLEQRVAERTAVAERRTQQLESLHAELTSVEQRERKHLAEVLHDGLQQLLVAAKMQISQLEKAAVDDRQKQNLHRVNEILAESIHTSRSLTAELTPVVLYERGLAAGLEWLARYMADNHKLKVDVSVGEQSEPDRESVRALFFQAAKELLLNTVKYAGVDSAKVSLRHQNDQRICMTVEDQGNGFEVAHLEARRSTTGGFGLFTLRERLEAVDGSLEIQSAPGQGTRVVLSVPFIKC